MRQPSRRQVLKALGVGVAASAVPFAFPVGASAQAPRPAPATPSAPTSPAAQTAPSTPDAPAPWSWIAPLAVGDRVAYGWKVGSLSAVERGRVVLGLSHALGATAEVHVHLRDGAPRGIAHTRTLDLLLMNGARGSTPSDESLGLAILALGRRIARNERTGLVRADQLAALQRHDRIPVNA